MNDYTTPWFKHDYNARRDPKLIRLARVKGMKGIGIYWSLIEIMHEQEGSIGKDEISDIAFELREDENNVLSILNEFDLFVIEERYYCNTRVLQSLDERKGKSETARANVLTRWAKYKKLQLPEKQDNNTPVLPKEYDSNTTREEESREEQRRKESGFEIFWKSYPKKKSKGKAEKAWKQANVKNGMLEIMLAKIELLKKSKDWTKDGGQFIPYPATWLNAKGWEDEVLSGQPETSEQRRHRLMMEDKGLIK